MDSNFSSIENLWPQVDTCFRPFRATLKISEFEPQCTLKILQSKTCEKAKPLLMIAVYFVLKYLNLTNSYAGLIMVYAGSSGLGYLICKGFFDTIPISLREAAKLDGASDARVFFQVVLPMSKPILVYTIISSFMVSWTDFVMAKMILNSGVSADWTVAIGLYNMLQKTLINNYFALFCAGGVLVSIPISILFVIMQKFYVEGITSGADKG